MMRDQIFSFNEISLSSFRGTNVALWLKQARIIENFLFWILQAPEYLVSFFRSFRL